MPGTTRDYIEVPLALAGIPVLLVDTAGLRETRDNVEAIGIARTAELIHRSDILLWLGPADETPDHPRLIAVHSKADLSERKSAPQGSLAVSSVTAEGLTELLERLAIFAGALLPAEDAIALNRRQWTATRRGSFGARGCCSIVGHSFDCGRSALGALIT